MNEHTERQWVWYPWKDDLIVKNPETGKEYNWHRIYNCLMACADLGDDPVINIEGMIKTIEKQAMKIKRLKLANIKLQAKSAAQYDNALIEKDEEVEALRSALEGLYNHTKNDHHICGLNTEAKGALESCKYDV